MEWLWISIACCAGISVILSTGAVLIEVVFECLEE
jgi:hypothetical protein